METVLGASEIDVSFGWMGWGGWEWGGAVGNGFFDLKGPEKEGGSSLEKK